MADIVDLPQLFTEAEAADRLGLSVYTLARERKAGRIAYRKMRRGVRYTAGDLAGYVESIRVPSCRDDSASKSVATGSASGPTARHGAGPGSIVSLDRHAAHRLAQQILKPRS